MILQTHTKPFTSKKRPLTEEAVKTLLACFEDCTEVALIINVRKPDGVLHQYRFWEGKEA